MRSFQNELREMAEEDFRLFQSRLVPTKLEILGVRIPKIRSLAKDAYREDAEAALSFLEESPASFEEAFLQAFLIEQVRDPEACYELIEAFLPGIDNWSVCDSFHPRAILKDTDLLRAHAKAWCEDPREFVRRFGIVTFLRDLTGAGFDPADPDLIASIVDDRYYVRMAQAWYFQKALATQKETVWPYFEEHRLSDAVEPLAIRKCLESRVFSEDEKDRLRKLRSGRKPRCSQNATKL